MTLLRNGTAVDDPRLDRLISERTDHLEKYPLMSIPSTAQPIVGGINWYSSFDEPRPIRVGRRDLYIIGDGQLGYVRGGHAICFPPAELTDVNAWWTFYNQQAEGRCVEFAMLRALSLVNRKRYDITSRWHYHEAQRGDEWEGGSYPGAEPQYEGTSVRAGLEVLRSLGAIPARRMSQPVTDPLPLVRPAEGINAYRWAQTWDDVRSVLRVPDNMPGVPFLNSWGTSYPRVTILADAAGERVLNEWGEFGVITDR